MAELLFGGGINETDRFNISTDECIQGENFILDSRRRNYKRRPPQDLKGTATNGGAIRAIMQMRARDQTVTTLVKAGAVMYSWDGTTFTSEKTDLTAASRQRSTHWSLDDTLVITDIDKLEPLWKWDGTNLTRWKTGLVVGSSSSVTITRSGSTATVTHTAHGFSTDDLVTISGADQAEYNGEFQITVIDVDTYTYTVTGSPASPATGESLAADLGVALKAKYAAVKDGRVWLFNVTTDATDLSHAILASKFETPENFDTAVRGKSQDIASAATGSDPFFLLTPDLKCINGVTFFFNQLVISTEDGALYKLTGSDPTDYNFVDYYQGSAGHADEGMVNVGNDVMYVKRDGDIDRLSDTERSGDVRADDVSRFIPITKRSIEHPIAVYDQAHQRVVWFENGFVLVFDKDSFALAPEVSPWMKWTTLMSNQFTTEAATYLRRPGSTGDTVYWGDGAGNIYDMNGTGSDGDNGTFNIESFRKTRYITELFTNIDMLEGRVQYQRVGNADLTLSFEWGEEYNTTTCVVPLKGPTISGSPLFWGDPEFYWNEDDYWNTGTVTGDSDTDNLVSTVGFSAAGRSPGFFLKLSASSTEDIVIDRIKT